MTLALVLLAAQMSTAELKELRAFRYGRTAEQVEAMGMDAYAALFRSKGTDHDTGLFRGVASAVFVDAYRENTLRRYRVPSATKARLVAIDKQMRFVGVLFARNDWAFQGGNGLNPEADEIEYAEAERRLYTLRGQTPDPARMRRRLATYRKEIRERGRKETFFGFLERPAEGRREIERNLAKIDGAVKKADGLCRTPSERAVLYDFVAARAIARL